MKFYKSKRVAIFQTWIYLDHREIVEPISGGSTQVESGLLINIIQEEMHYEKITLARIIYFRRRHLDGWLLVFSVRTNGAGDPASGRGSHTGAYASACRSPAGSSAQTGPQLNTPAPCLAD